MRRGLSFQAYKGTPITPAQYINRSQKVAHAAAEHKAVPNGMVVGMRLQT